MCVPCIIYSRYLFYSSWNVQTQPFMVSYSSISFGLRVFQHFRVSPNPLILILFSSVDEAGLSGEESAEDSGWIWWDPGQDLSSKIEIRSWILLVSVWRTFEGKISIINMYIRTIIVILHPSYYHPSYLDSPCPHKGFS